MRVQGEKWLLLFLCAALSLGLGGMGLYAVVPLIAAIVEAALCEALRKESARMALPCTGALAAFFYPPLFFYLPVFIYDVWRPARLTLMFCFLPALLVGPRSGALGMALVVILMALAALMKQHADVSAQQLRENHHLRDDAVELLRALREKNSELVERQDDVAKMATLSERARIARDLHDSVGHVLSSALLQTGALMALSDNVKEKERLSLLNITLSEGMNEVREAVHHLRDESLDLRDDIEKLARSFSFCPVTIEYDAGDDMQADIKLAFAAIIKEGLSNAARHSQADRITILVQEHPAFYQLVIRDNGRVKGSQIKGGMGLDNIRSRVEQLDGLARIGYTDEGFEIFVSIKKGE